MSMDDDGKIWLVERGGRAWSGQLPDPDSVRRVHGARPVRAGLRQVRGRRPARRHAGRHAARAHAGRQLNHFTSTTGPRSSAPIAIPPDLHGDLLFADPVGRFIRRAKIVKTEGLTQVRNVYPGSEFIISTDPLFRPVNIKHGPDGAIYIVDMYHGIIQDANWTRPGLVPAPQDRAVSAGQGRSTTAGSGGCASTACRRFRQLPAGPAAPASRRSRPAGIPLDTTWPRMNDETPRSSSRTSVIRTAGGATPRSGCSS